MRVSGFLEVFLEVLAQVPFCWDPFHVHLYEPQIPQNTGNIGRLCVGAHCTLHLVGSLGFKLDEKSRRRAGLDYWQYLSWEYHPVVETWQAQLSSPFFLISKFGKRSLYQTLFPTGSHFIFGSESTGLPRSFLEEYSEQTIFIPMLPECRSLNLSNAVAIVVYEAIRQQFQAISSS